MKSLFIIPAVAIAAGLVAHFGFDRTYVESCLTVVTLHLWLTLIRDVTAKKPRPSSVLLTPDKFNHEFLELKRPTAGVYRKDSEVQS